MKKLEFSIEIKASKEKVWESLWKQENYRKWAAVFNTGSHYRGDLVEGNQIQFLDAKDNGMFADVTKVVPFEKMHFVLLGEVLNGVSQEVIYEKDSFEQYDLLEKDSHIVLSITLKTVEEYFQFFLNFMPKALEKIKEIAESSDQ